MNTFLSRAFAFAAVSFSTFCHARADDRDVEAGRQLFVRDWIHNPIEPIAQGELNLRQFAVKLSAQEGDGLGPLYNATSCEACHVRGGASGIDRNVTMLTIEPRSPLISRINEISIDPMEAHKQLSKLYPGIVGPTGIIGYDIVLHEKSTRPFYDSLRSGIADHVPGGISAEWYQSEKRTSEAIAERPVIAGRVDDLDFYLSQRNSPPLFGLSLISRIEMERLATLSRYQANRSKGDISGRVGPGKFGWRAQTLTLAQFVRNACAGELGLQTRTSLQPPDAADDSYLSLGNDLTEEQVTQLVSYVESLKRPIQETRIASESAEIKEGESHFNKVGCADCHVPNVFPAKGIYSDLLLHDMGEHLQAPSPASMAIPRKQQVTFRRFVARSLRISDRREALLRSSPLSSSFGVAYYGTPSSELPRPYEYAERPMYPQFPYGQMPLQVFETESSEPVTWDVLQREWRTPPLWGVADSGPYLHDGRAGTLDAAIRWHDGEAKSSVTNYRTLTKKQQRSLIAFLESLKAPAESRFGEVESLVNWVE